MPPVAASQRRTLRTSSLLRRPARSTRPARALILALAVTMLLAAGCGSSDPVNSATIASTESSEPAVPNAEDSAARDGESENSAAAVDPAPTTTPTSAEAGADEAGADEAGADEAEDPDTDRPAENPEPTPTTEIPEFVPPTGIEPNRIVIESIDVDAPVIDLSLSGELPEVPTDFDDTGWYTQTRLPGEIGPAVIAGHIDSRRGPAVFAELDQLQPGDRIEVSSSGGETRMFEVVDSAQYPKGDLPDEVFGFGGPEPELRLITCGGTFDPDAGHYRDNFIVFARAVDTDDAGA